MRLRVHGALVVGSILIGAAAFGSTFWLESSRLVMPERITLTSLVAGEVHEEAVVVRNTGGSVLKIIGCEKICKDVCVSLLNAPIDVPPRSSGSLKLRIYVQSPGDSASTIAIYTDESGHQSRPLTVAVTGASPAGSKTATRH